MSTTTQRPTPETDAAFRDGYTFCREDMRPAVEFCANLERERDEAREQLESILNVIPADAPCLHAETGETVADYILDLQKEVGRVHALYFNNKQQLEAMREALQWILTSASDGSIPDGRNLWAITQKAQSALAKLLPFLKP